VCRDSPLRDYSMDPPERIPYIVSPSNTWYLVSQYYKPSFNYADFSGPAHAHSAVPARREQVAAVPLQLDPKDPKALRLPRRTALAVPCGCSGGIFPSPTNASSSRNKYIKPRRRRKPRTTSPEEHVPRYASIALVARGVLAV